MCADTRYLNIDSFALLWTKHGGVLKLNETYLHLLHPRVATQHVCHVKTMANACRNAFRAVVGAPEPIVDPVTCTDFTFDCWDASRTSPSGKGVGSRSLRRCYG